MSVPSSPLVALRHFSLRLLVILTGLSGLAASAAPVKFDIPAQPAAAALQLFVKQSGTEVLYIHDEVAAVKSHPVKGEMEPSAALTALLSGTGFEASQTADRSFVVKKTPRAKMATGSVQGSLALPDGSPAERILVLLGETGQSASTDRNGNFVFPEVLPGTYTLVVNARGYQQLHITDVTVAANQELTIGKESLRKASDATELEPYVVKAEAVTSLEKYEVTSNKVAPFSDANVDLPRGIDDVQPYYIFNAQTIQQSGAVDVEDFLKTRLTMDTTALSNGQQVTVLGNTSTISLRGLGASQTLILIDGRRTASVSYYGTNYQPDINGVPLAAIDRIEVLPSSASAIYGGSAVGGVINIVLKKDYQGGEIKVTYDNPFNTDAPLRSLDATYGFAADGGKTHVLLSAHYTDGKVMLLQDRVQLVNRGYSTILRNDPGFFISDTSYPILGATPNIGSGAYANGGYQNLTLKNGGTSLNSPIATIAAGASAADASTIIPGQWNYTLAPTEEQYGLLSAIGSVPKDKSFMASVRQLIFPKLEAFIDISTESNSSVSLYDPINTATGYYVPSNAAANPFNQGVYVSFANTLTEPEITDSVTRSISVGLVAQLPFNWKSEMDYTWSQNAFEVAYDAYDGTALSAAIANGTVNPFVDTLAHPLNLVPFLAPYSYTGTSTVNDLAARGSGPVATLPWGRPTLTVGLEHRKEGNTSSNIYSSFPITTAQTSQTTFFGKSQSIDSAYAEAEVPIITAKNSLPLLHELDLQLAARTEDYSVGTGTSGSAYSPNHTPPTTSYLGTTVNGQPYHSTTKYTSTNPTAGLKYVPVDGVTLRASYGTAFLPPTYTQLLNNPVPSTSLTTITDPQNNQRYGVQTVQNLNGDLKPQNSKDWDVGAIWEPKAEILKGLRFDLEFFQIKEFDVISSPPGGAQFIVNNAATYANRITRSSTTGLITLVDTSSVNLYELETTGWDISADYRKPTSFGTFELYALGTIQEHYKQQTSVTGPLLDYVGYVAEGGPAKTKANATLTWERGHWQLGWTTEFFDGYKQYGAPGGPAGTFTKYTLAQGGYTIPSQLVHNLFASYSFGKRKTGSRVGDKLASDWTIQAGIKNVFNTLPPFDAYYSPYYYSPYGDPRLRDLWVSIKKEF